MINKLIVFIMVLFISGIASAHPGRTASDGCHYCRTNCDSWGVPWNTRHCHNSITDHSLTSTKMSNQNHCEDMSVLSQLKESIEII